MKFRFVLNSADQGSMVLEKEPQGWKDIEVMLKRSPLYHGIFYEAMAQLEFTCRSGKEFIDTEIELRGVDAVINILIQVSCQSGTGSIESPDYSIDYSDDYGSMIQGSGSPVFETLFEGVLNLSNYTQTSESTTVDLIQSDFVQKVINRFETKVNLDVNEDLDGNALDDIANVPYLLDIPSKAIRYGSKLQLDETLQEDPFVFPDPDPSGGSYAFFYVFHPVTPVYNDLGLEPHFPIVESNDSLLAEIPSLFVAPFTGTYSFPYALAGNIKVKSNDSGGGPFNFAIFLKYGVNQTGGASTAISGNIGGNVSAGATVDFPFSESGTLTISLNEGDRFQFYFRIGTGTFGVQTQACEITLEYTQADVTSYIDTISAASQSFSYYIHEAAALIAQRITGQNDAFRSNLLGRKNSLPTSYDSNGCLSFMATTNGKSIRNYPAEQSNYFTSMADFFRSINSIGNVGMGFDLIDGAYVIRIEEKEYYYSPDVVLQFPLANKITISVAKEYYVSDVIIGYSKWENEETNGIDEFNSKREYNTGIKAVQNRVDLLSPYIGSAYAIEFTRRKPYVNYPTLDWKYDDDNFIICLNRSVDGSGVPNNLNTVEKDENYDQINNVFSPESTYNYRISPARNLLRHLSVISGSLTKYLTRVIKFVYGEGNYLAQTEFTNDSCPGNFNNDLLSESQDILWNGSGADPIWIPEYIEFDYPLSFSNYLLIKADPRKCIEVSQTSSDFIRGYIIELRYKPVGGIATFKLLRAWESE